MAALSSTKINQWLVLRRWPDAEKELSLMDRLFNRMDGMYPNKWRANFQNPDSIENWQAAWAEAFDQEGISPNEVMAGIAACRKQYDWPPSLPEFLKACRPVFNYERAFFEAVIQMRKRETGEDKWPSPAVYWAAARLGSDLFSQSYIDLKGRWAQALDKAVEDIRAGLLPRAVPERRSALPAPGKSSTTKEQAKANIARLKEMLEGSRLVGNA
jgi:hypothetical protein